MPYPKKEIEYDIKPHDTAPRDPVTGIVTKPGFVSWIRDGVSAYRRGYPVVAKEIQAERGQVNIARVISNFIDTMRLLVSSALRLPLKNVTKASDVERGEIWCDADLIKYRANIQAELIETLEKMSNKGKPNGYAPLDSAGAIPISCLPNVVETKDRCGVANGYAPLDGNAKVALAYLPQVLELTTNKGVANGYAPLDESSLIPREHLKLRMTTISSNTQLSLSYHIYLCNASSNAIIISLPTSATVTGQCFVIKKIDDTTNSVTIQANGTETIDGQSSIALTSQWSFVRIASTGQGWIII